MAKNQTNKLSRRGFLGWISSAGVVSLIPHAAAHSSLISTHPQKSGKAISPKPFSFPKRRELNLDPARWIWYPAERILPNSFFHFRREIKIKKAVRAAKGWILGESRYLFMLNGIRIQFGPAPSDPRFSEADPLDLSAGLQEGENVLAATVVYFGFGDGAWPTGKAGFIFKLDIEYQDGDMEHVVSDGNWSVQYARSWPAGKYKRWYLRSLQEVFDNRHYPHGWNKPGFKEDNTWQKAALFSKEGNSTALSSSISDYLYDSGGDIQTQLRKRSVPLLQEKTMDSFSIKEAHYVDWKVPVEEYFDFKTANAFQAGEVLMEFKPKNGRWTFAPPKGEGQGLVISFELNEQAIGWPYFTIEAEEGTNIEVMVQQSHRLLKEGGPPLINNNFHSWTRFICKEGENKLITFDYESVKWIQLHIHHTNKPISITSIVLKRRVYDFPYQPQVESSHEGLNTLLKACVNTVWNNSHETIVDCVGRERQQYSGDIGHMLHALHTGFGESRLPFRFVDTFSQGLTLGDFFMDSWPAYDRLNRMAQRQLGLTPWGVLLDHSVGFCFDCWHHYLYTGKKEDFEEIFPRLLRFYGLIKRSLEGNSLLPVENLGMNAVWMDTDSYKSDRDKQCAYNLYVASMLKQALAPLAEAFGETNLQKEMLAISEDLAKRVESQFYSPEEKLLIINLPWATKDGEKRTCERSLAHWVLGGFAPDSTLESIKKELASKPERLGRCYPANVIWLYWTWAALGDTQEIMDDFGFRWLEMLSVKENNTIQESWKAEKDTQSQLSHSGIAPFFASYMCFAGITMLNPGGSLVQIKPQLASLESLRLTYHTSKGTLRFEASGKLGNRRLKLSLPHGVNVNLVVPTNEQLPKGIEKITKGQNGWDTYRLEEGKDWEIGLKHV
ncbi:alpha-L-rhamnosidase-related protein [Pleomorphovibrio marinus]|uniref:alpha-L-rhamnosidase-related protein n=1 Tax=Pleomorphovibrio marinus TaxID=2164132 RepID=UPI000E0A15D1|nr:alpha-L-rhamnosidase N-terminal domain-containing protein [Pleomorphovibrio marinus]